MKVSLVVAADDHDLIGAGGALPWHLPDDLKRFRRLTTGHVVVVGRITQESIVRRLGHALPGRTTIVVSRTPRDDEGGTLFRTSVEAALAAARDAEPAEAFVIGGAEIYAQALPSVGTIHLTRVRGRHAGDTYLPSGFLDGFTLVEREDHDGYAFERWERS